MQKLEKIEIEGLVCQRCGWKWKPRKKVIHVCPGCHSYRWNEK